MSSFPRSIMESGSMSTRPIQRQSFPNAQASKMYPPPVPTMTSSNSDAPGCSENAGFTVPRQPIRGYQNQQLPFHNPTPMALQTNNQQQHSFGSSKPLQTFPLPRSYHVPARLPKVQVMDTSEDQGGITTDEGFGTSNENMPDFSSSSGSRSTIDFQQDRAPPFDCLAHYAAHLAATEHRDVLQMQMAAMYEKANKDLKDIHPDRGVALPHDSVGMLFHICHRLKTSDDVKYLACEIYDRYIIKSTAAIKAEIGDCQDEGQIKDIIERLRQQVLLRMGSCIQLASKISAPGGFGKFISSAQLKRVLMSFNQNYSLKAINKAEARTVMQLDWKLSNVTTLNILEILLIQLDGVNPGVYRRVYHISTYILDFIYLNRDEVYTRLFQELSAKYDVTKEKFREMVQFSKIIEGVSVLGTALLSEFSFKDPIFEKLEKISHVDCADVLQFARVVLKGVHERDSQLGKENQILKPAPVKMSSSASISIIT